MLQKMWLRIIRGVCGLLSLVCCTWAAVDFIKTDQYASLTADPRNSRFFSYFIQHLFWAVIVIWIGWSIVLSICHMLEGMCSRMAAHVDRIISFFGRFGVEVLQMPGIIVFPVISNKLSLYVHREMGAKICVLAMVSISFQAIMLMNYTDYGLFEMIECIFLAIVFGLRNEDMRSLFIMATVCLVRRLAVFVIKECVGHRHNVQAVANLNELLNAVNDHTNNLKLQIVRLSGISRARRPVNRETLHRLSIQMTENVDMLQAVSRRLRAQNPNIA